VLSDALHGLSAPSNPDLLVGFETSDDAAVYRLTDDMAIVSTVDFITPPVDDPYWFGQIAAANAISDVYSMGGRPLTALNLVMFPSKYLDMGVLREILRGGNDKVIEAGACLVGGHSVDDEEPKYGLSVNGVVHPSQIVTNSGARPGDALILTKPLGTGVLFNSVRSGKLTLGDIEREILPSVAALNGAAMQTALQSTVHGCTDITGFGILGHLLEVARGSTVRAIVEYAALPFYPGARDMYAKGETTGSNGANRELVGNHLDIRTSLTKVEEELLFDPQTSGGLLLSVPNDEAKSLVEKLHANGVTYAARIGEVEAGTPGITVR
jgi:selenide,water dikinase